jgi:hypothetical protein
MSSHSRVLRLDRLYWRPLLTIVILWPLSFWFSLSAAEILAIVDSRVGPVRSAEARLIASLPFDSKRITTTTRPESRH